MRSRQDAVSYEHCRRGAALKAYWIQLSLALFAIFALPANAWKVGTHVYSANMLLDEIRANNGQVEIAPFGKFNVDVAWLAAITAYPDYFRAGAEGPDVFPDIYVGQVIFHPGQAGGGSDSSYFLTSFWEGANSEAAPDRKQQTLAFMLGFQVHAAGDFFGHSYVNNWAGGTWPSILDGTSQDEVKIIMRHNVVEAYVDQKVPPAYKTEDRIRISAPRQFIMNRMVCNNRAENRGDLSKDQRDIAPILRPLPIHFKEFYDLRRALRQASLDIDNKGTLEKIANVLLAAPVAVDAAKKAYIKRWIEDIDNGLSAWVETSERVAQGLLREHGIQNAKNEIKQWGLHNIISMTGAPDANQSIAGALFSAKDFVDGLLPQSLRDLQSKGETMFADEFFSWFLPFSFTEFEAMIRTPSAYLSNPSMGLFNADAITKLTADMGNFGSATLAKDQTFLPFYNTVVLAKLALIGDAGINELRRKAYVQRGLPSPEPQKTFNVPFLQFVDSFDEGYDWNVPSMGNCKLWIDATDRDVILSSIFKQFVPSDGSRIRAAGKTDPRIQRKSPLDRSMISKDDHDLKAQRSGDSKIQRNESGLEVQPEPVAPPQQLDAATAKQPARGAYPDGSRDSGQPAPTRESKGGVLAGEIPKRAATTNSVEQPTTPSQLERDPDCIVLLGTYLWDVESNSQGGAGHQGADFWWEQVSDTERYLVPKNGAKATVITGRDFASIDAAFIAAQRLSNQRISGSDANGVLTAGAIVAFRTAEGNLGKLQVEGYRALNDFSFPEVAFMFRGRTPSPRNPDILLYHLQVRRALYRSAATKEQIEYVEGFAGEWDSIWGLIKFTVNGVHVHGEYTHDKGRIDATLSRDGRTMTGRWAESPSYKPPADAGNVTFTLAPDGNGFAGQYGYGDNLGGGDWTGTRVAANPPAKTTAGGTPTGKGDSLPESAR